MSELPPEHFPPSSTITFVEGLPFALQSQIQMALAEIDLLHRIPKRMQATVLQNAKRSEQGSYDPRLARIEISRYATDPLGTFIHEYGHFVDNRALHPMSKEYTSLYDDDLDPLLKACFRSTPIRDIAHLLKAKRRRLSRGEWIYLKHIHQPHEIFARAYAQWVCSKSFSFLLQNSMQRRVESKFLFVDKMIRLQWEPREFADIMVAMERALALKGLL